MDLNTWLEICSVEISIIYSYLRMSDQAGGSKFWIPIYRGCDLRRMLGFHFIYIITGIVKQRSFYCVG